MSRIDDVIDDLAVYISNAKGYMLSQDKAIIERDHVMHLIESIQSVADEELKVNERVRNQQQEILETAKKRSSDMMNSAQAQVNKMVDQSEIVQQAQFQAGEIIKQATDQYNEIVGRARAEHEAYTNMAREYLDTSLAEIQRVLTEGIRAEQSNSEAMIATLSQLLSVATGNREQIYAAPIEPEQVPNN